MFYVIETQYVGPKREHPIVQAFHTGLWGYARYLDCVDLNQCVYKSKAAAERARKKEYTRYIEDCRLYGEDDDDLE